MKIETFVIENPTYSEVAQTEPDLEKSTKSKPNCCTRFMKWIIKNPQFSVPLCLGLFAFGYGAGTAVTYGLFSIGAIGGLSNRKIEQVHNESTYPVTISNESTSSVLEPTTQIPMTPEPTTQKPTTQKPTTQKPTTQKPTTQKPTTPELTAPVTTTSKLYKEAYCEGYKKTEWMRCLKDGGILGGTSSANEHDNYVWMSLDPDSPISKNTYGSCVAMGIWAICPKKCTESSPLIVQNRNTGAIERSQESLSKYCNSKHSASVRYQE